jgi:hypothetical protein
MKFRLSIACLALGSLLCSLPSQAAAGPWIDVGNEELRHHIQILADAGVITVPITSWPLMWSGIAKDIQRPAQPNLSSAQHWSLSYVRFAYREASKPGSRLSWRAGLRKDPNYFTHFGSQQREAAEASVTADWLGERFSVKAVATYADNPADGKDARYDGSYMAGVFGNWSLSLGAIDRWWGPGWQNNLILSNNARPIPGIALQRNYSDPFETPWLSWLGPWQLTTFIGQMENARYVPETKHFGMRISIRPFNSLELGLSRTAQWGGEGRPEDLSTFWKMLIGKDNRGDDLSIDDEPGNQLAGIDWRWAGNPWGQNLGFYGQAIGEDEAGSAPSRFLALLGLETAFISDDMHTRLYLEAMDSASEVFKSSPRYNYAYEHAIYKSGYRYRSRPIGASTDNDSRMLTLKADHYFSDNSSLSWAVSKIDLNRDNANVAAPGGNLISAKALDLYSLDISYSRLFGNLKATIGLDHLSETLRINDESVGGSGAHLVLEYRL